MLIADHEASSRGLCVPNPSDPLQGTGFNGKPVTPREWLNYLSIEDLFSFEFETDAHLWPAEAFYQGEVQGAFPRLRKEALAAVVAAGVDVRHLAVFIDVDLQDLPGMPRGVAWADLPPDRRHDVRADLRARAEDLDWSMFYTTKRGCRFVHRLAEPVPTGANFERLVAQVRARYDAAGVPTDPRCCDWTRLYRCPRVTREDGTKTWEQDWYLQDTRPDNFLVPDLEFMKRDLARAAAPVVGRSVAMDDGEAHRLATEDDVAKKVERLTRGNRFHAPLFSGSCLATEDRHNTLLSLIGYLCGVVRQAGGTAEHVYALAREATKTMSDEGHDWRAEAAEMTAAFWSRDDAEHAFSKSIRAYEERKKQAPAPASDQVYIPDPQAAMVPPVADVDPGDFSVPSGKTEPNPCAHNVRVALFKLGARVWKDRFLEQSLISWADPKRPDMAAVRVISNEETLNLWNRCEEQFRLKVGYDTFDKWLDVLASHNGYHPVRDYLSRLKWDGKPRIDRWLVTYAGAPDTEFVRAVGAIFLVAGVRRIFKPGCIFQEMLLLESPDQGKGKSLGLKALFYGRTTNDPSDEDRGWFTDSLKLGVSGKEVLEQTLGKWGVEAGELVGMQRGAVQELKSFLSRDTDAGRLSYERRVLVRPRQFVIAGTTNGTEYLLDWSGNRRFWCVRVQEVDVAGIRRDRDQLWAEAAHLEAQGASIRLDPSLYPVAAQEQEQRRVEDPFEGALTAHFDGVTGPCRIAVADVWQLLGYEVKHQKQSDVSRLGQAMGRLGFVKKQAALDDGRNTKCFVRGDGTEHLSVKRVGQSAKIMRGRK